MKNIFYSWQSDIEGNRNYLEDCLKKAASLVGNFQVDTATRDAQGSPNINDDIIRRIEEADLFVGDVSIINPNETNGRKCPNPNVMFELGYALKKLGETNLILIVNTSTTRIDELPFDIRNRRLLSRKFKNENKELLINELVEILRLYEPGTPAEIPYAYFTLESVSSNGDMKFRIYNNDSKPYFIEGIELALNYVILNEDLPPQSRDKFVSFNLPNYPFDSSFENMSFIVSHQDVRIRVFQKVILEARADQKFNLQSIEKRPSHAVKI